MSYTNQTHIMLQNFMSDMNVSNEAYVPPEIEQQNRLDNYNELMGTLNHYHQQEVYNTERKNNSDFGKKAQEMYDNNIDTAIQKIEKLKVKKEKNNQEKIRKQKKYKDLIEKEKQRILSVSTENSIGTVDKTFVKFVTERYDPAKRRKNKQKQTVFNKDIVVNEYYTNKEREKSLFDLDFNKIKEQEDYKYQTADYFNKKTVVFYPDEKWVPLYDIPDIYMISNYGRLYNKKLKYLIKPLFVDYTALYFIYYPGTTPKYERRKSESIAKMMLQSFCPVADPAYHTVIYIDGDKRNLHLSNLKWKTKNDKELNMRQVAPEWMKSFSKANGRQTKYIL